MAREGIEHSHRLPEDRFKYIRYGRGKKQTYDNIRAMFKAKNVPNLLKVATKIASKQDTKRLVKMAFKKSGQRYGDKALKEAMKDLGEMLGVAGLNTTKQFLIEEMGFDKKTVDDGLIFDMDNKTVHVRGELRDTLDFEYYGVPKHVWPNVTRIKAWIKNRVIMRDPMLKKTWSGLRGRNAKIDRASMLNDLAFLFSRAIFRDGLKKRPTTMIDDPDSPGEQKAIDVDWKGRQVKVKQIREEAYMGERPSYNSKWRSK